MTKQPWYDDPNPSRAVRGASWRGAIWIACAVLFVGLLGVGIWAFKVGTSGPKGAGDAVRTKNSGGNRIAAQERFEELYAQVKAADQRVGVMHTTLQAAPTDVVARTNYTGAVNYCIDVRAQYDAEARKYTAAEWRSVDLPQQIDQHDKATDCKENPK